MFGFRPDGRAVGNAIDPITRLTPYIMTQRSDSQVFCTQYADAEPISEFIRKKHSEGVRISHMSVIIAAYLRGVSEMPQLNRFVVNKSLYARNEFTCTFMTVKVKSREDFLETASKIYLDPADTVFTVSRKVEEVIAQNRAVETDNGTDKLARAFFAVPLLPNIGVGLCKLLDRYGLLPKKIIDVSPFHTSLFISNMASIKMSEIFHHIYNFGTTSVFLGVGRKTARLRMGAGGKISFVPCYPLGCVIDERIAPGAQFSMFFSLVQSYLRHPELLEQPPANVKYDIIEYHCKEDD